MTTTTRTARETSRVVGEPGGDPAPAPVPWSKLAPSDYAVLARMFPFKIPGNERPAGETGMGVGAQRLAPSSFRIPFWAHIGAPLRNGDCALPEGAGMGSG